MSVARLIALVLAGLVLAGCFQTEQEIITAAEAEFPFTSITYRTTDDDESYTLSRKGSGYTAEDEDTTVRLKKVGDNMWLIQTAFVDGDQTLYLYAVAVMDADGKGFRVYKALAEDADRDPAVLKKYGLKLCEDDDENICPPTRDAYLAYARARIAAGDEPSGTFMILSRR